MHRGTQDFLDDVCKHLQKEIPRIKLTAAGLIHKTCVVSLEGSSFAMRAQDHEFNFCPGELYPTYLHFIVALPFLHIFLVLLTHLFLHNFNLFSEDNASFSYTSTTGSL